jgi:16S rRNA (guanine527-N7)-methyltransferase
LDAKEKQFREALRRGAKILGLSLDTQGEEQLTIHWRLLCRWSQHVNLTTVQDAADMAELLYLDSAVMVPHLMEGGTLHDVGTGAGFPGLVLKVLMPSLRVTLTEARRKKVSFLRQAAREMGIKEGLEIRWERVGWKDRSIPQAAPLEQTWMEVVSKAAFPRDEWISLGQDLVAAEGRLWILASAQEEDDRTQETELPPSGWVLDKKIRYQLPFSKRNRVLLAYRLFPIGRESKL